DLVIFRVHVDGTIRVRVLVREQDRVALALDDLKRVRHVRRPRDAGHVALRFRIRRGPPGTILFAFRERLRQVRDRTADDDALARRDRRDRAELPELFELLGRVPFEVPVGGVHRLPDSVQVRLVADAVRPLARLPRGAGRHARRESAQDGKWKSVAHALYYSSRGSAREKSMRTLIKPVNARKELKNFGALAGYASLSVAAVLLASGARAQDSGAAPEPAVPAEQTAAAFADPEWSVPRLSWGDPDLQGTFTSRDMSGIPMERPQQFGTRRQLNAEEFAERLAGGARSEEHTSELQSREKLV